jgi:septation ring formation regulator EzrA
MEDGLLIAILVNIVGISVAVWFLRSRIRAKLAEVEARKEAQRERELERERDSA